MRKFAACLLMLAASCTTPVPAALPDLGRDLALVFPSGCSDGMRDGTETDVDCGGDLCARCSAGKACLHGTDCDSNICDNNACAGPSCTDRLRNGGESDVDCGGSCPGCMVGKMCLVSSDCMSNNCINNTCQPGRCENGVKDDQETDVDCGGPSCPACANGKSCLMGSDCQAMRCINNVCQVTINCTAPMTNCDGNPMNGCNVNLNTDAKNCGRCGAACPMNMPTCSGGQCVGKPSVLIVASDGMAHAQDIASKLMASGSFSKIDMFLDGNKTPALADLKPYEVVLCYSNGRFTDPVTLGNNLADYYDGGGRVVLTSFANTAWAGIGVTGRFGNPANGYLLQDPSSWENGAADQLGNLNEPQSPLLVGVQAFSTQQSNRCLGKLLNGAVAVAQYRSGPPLVVRGTAKGRSRVDLNFFPVSADFGEPLYWKGDGAALIRNALLFR